MQRTVTSSVGWQYAGVTRAVPIGRRRRTSSERTAADTEPRAAADTPSSVLSCWRYCRRLHTNYKGDAENAGLENTGT